MRYYPILFVVLSVSALVLAASVTDAAPIEEAAPVPVSKGDIKWARPTHFIPPRHGNRKETDLWHPVVVVTDVDHNHEVKVAVVTHNHYKGIPARPANDYAPFHKGGFISVGRPRTINIDRLKPVHKPPTTVEPEKLGRLIQHISQNSPPDQWHLSERERTLGKQRGQRSYGEYRGRQRDVPRDKGKAQAQESRSPYRKGSRNYSPDGRRSGWRDKTPERSNNESHGRQGDRPRDKGKDKARESRSPDRRGVRRSGNYSPDGGRSGWRDKTSNHESRGRQGDRPWDKGKDKAGESRSPDRRGVRGSRNYSPGGRRSGRW